MGIGLSQSSSMTKGDAEIPNNINGFLQDETFNTPKIMYRGAPEGYGKFVNPGTGMIGCGVYLTDSYSTAVDYSDTKTGFYKGQQGMLHMFVTTATNFWDINKQGNPEIEFGDLPPKEMAKALQNAGYDGVIDKRYVGDTSYYTVFDSGKLFEIPEDMPINKEAFENKLKELGYLSDHKDLSKSVPEKQEERLDSLLYLKARNFSLEKYCKNAGYKLQKAGEYMKVNGLPGAENDVVLIKGNSFTAKDGELTGDTVNFVRMYEGKSKNEAILDIMASGKDALKTPSIKITEEPTIMK